MLPTVKELEFFRPEQRSTMRITQQHVDSLYNADVAPTEGEP